MLFDFILLSLGDTSGVPYEILSISYISGAHSAAPGLSAHKAGADVTYC